MRVRFINTHTHTNTHAHTHTRTYHILRGKSQKSHNAHVYRKLTQRVTQKVTQNSHKSHTKVTHVSSKQQHITYATFHSKQSHKRPVLRVHTHTTFTRYIQAYLMHPPTHTHITRTHTRTQRTISKFRITVHINHITHS